LGVQNRSAFQPGFYHPEGFYYKHKPLKSGLSQVLSQQVIIASIRRLIVGKPVLLGHQDIADLNGKTVSLYGGVNQYRTRQAYLSILAPIFRENRRGGACPRKEFCNCLIRLLFCLLQRRSLPVHYSSINYGHLLK
jgi:hypothetical protein